jgi:hypothetical protein
MKTIIKFSQVANDIIQTGTIGNGKTSTKANEKIIRL